MNEQINIYLLSDAHNLENEPIEAGCYFGDKIDLLVLNGDIPNHSGDVENFNSVYRIASGITKGECPIVFSRGNHDTRGIHAEDFCLYTPTCNGRTYYTFRVGSLWGMVLDCGEDKPDDHPEYGHTICFHNFRMQETMFIKQIIAESENQYNAAGVLNRIVICHIPFTYVHKPPFDIEQNIYSEWARLLRDYVKPQLLLYGHNHTECFCPVGGQYDHLGQPCSAIFAGKPMKDSDKNQVRYFGAAIKLHKDKAEIVFNSNDREILGKYLTQFN